MHNCIRLLPFERNVALDGMTGFGTESWTVDVDEEINVLEFTGDVARTPEFNGGEFITGTPEFN